MSTDLAINGPGLTVGYYHRCDSNLNWSGVGSGLNPYPFNWPDYTPAPLPVPISYPLYYPVLTVPYPVYVPVPAAPSDFVGDWKVVGHCTRCGNPVFAQPTCIDQPIVKRSCECVFEPGAEATGD